MYNKIFSIFYELNNKHIILYVYYNFYCSNYWKKIFK